jgi:hypothetical protein
MSLNVTILEQDVFVYIQPATILNATILEQDVFVNTPDDTINVTLQNNGSIIEIPTVSNVGAWTIKGNWDASTNTFPSGTILKGYQYFSTHNSTTLLMPDGGIIPKGTIIVARVDNPGQVVTNWYYLLSVVGDGTDWILSTGFWNDNGTWDDTANWID